MLDSTRNARRNPLGRTRLGQAALESENFSRFEANKTHLRRI